MKIFLTSAYPFHEVENFAVKWFKSLAQKDTIKKHTIVESPEDADVVLFLEHHPPADPYFFKVLKNNLVKKYKHKTILYTDADRLIPILPTLTPSIEEKYHFQGLCLSSPYIERHVSNESISFTKLDENRKYLFSFLGSCKTHPVRFELLKINYKDCFLKDTSDLVFWKLSEEEKIKLTTESVSVNKQSYFILCPRGVGVNTYRVYEVMKMGLVPVVISDEWVPMEGPAWNDFSIRIKEKDVLKIPQILEANKNQAIKMGNLARKNWEQWFSDEVMFNVLSDLAEKLDNNRSNNSLKNALYSYSQFLSPYHFRNLIRFCLKQRLTKLKRTKFIENIRF